MSGGGNSRQPKYRRIADALREAVQSGKYRPGDRLPGENDLMNIHGVARMTARQALAVLQSEGIAEARRGAGVFVRDFRPVRRRGIQRLAADNWGSGQSIWSVEAGGRDLRTDRLSVRHEPADVQVAAALGLSPDDEVCIRTRRFILDGKPVLLSTSYLPAGLVAGSRITQEDTGPGGTYARLAELGAAPVRFREEIRSRMPASQEADALSLPPGTPVVLVRRTAFTWEDRAVEINEMTLDAASYILEYDFGA